MRGSECLCRGLAIAACSVALTACQVEQERAAQMPDVDVSAEAGRWPRYDIAWADVDVGTEQRTVTVPVVSVTQETREITVPYIDINPPGSTNREERTIALEVDVPHAGYGLEIVEVRAAQDDLWVIGRLTASDGAAAQVRSRVMDQVVVRAPEDLDVREVIVGQPPEGGYSRGHRFVDSMQALDQLIPAGARVVYRRAR